MPIDNAHIIRAWKDEAFRATLSPDLQAELPAHPAGRIEVRERDVGQAGPQELSFLFCTNLFCATHLNSCGCHPFTNDGGCTGLSLDLC